MNNNFNHNQPLDPSECDGPDDSATSRDAISRRDEGPDAQPVHIVAGAVALPGQPILGQELAPGDAPVSVPSKFNVSSLLRFKKTILLVSLAIALPLLLGIWVTIQPTYRAKAELRIRPIIPHIVFPRAEDTSSRDFYQSYVNTQVAVMYSPSVIHRVLEQPEVRGTTWYKKLSPEGTANTAGSVEALRSGLTIAPRPQTEIVDVSFTSPSSAEATAILKAVLEQYMRFVRQQANQSDDSIYKELQSQCGALQAEIDAREKVLDKLKKELGTATPDEMLTRRKMRLDEEGAAVDRLRLEIASLQWQQDELAELVKQDPTSTQPSKRYAGDIEWRRLYLDMRNLQLQFDNDRQRFQETSPAVIQTRKRLELATELLHSREAVLDGQTHLYPTTAPGSEVTLSVELEALRRKLKLLQYEEKLRADWLAEQQTDFTKTFASAETLTKEKADLAHRRETYDAVRGEMEKKQVERNVPGSIEVLTPAYASSGANDKRGILSLAALALALAAGVGVGYFRSASRQPIFHRDELPHALQQPFLGYLPLVSNQRLDNPELAEGIRIIRTALLARLHPRQGSAFLVSSSDIGAGKSTVALMLARSLAASGKKVLLVDADLRHPALTNRLSLQTNPGLMGLLARAGTDDEVISPTETPNLSFLQAGALPGEIDLEWIANGEFTAGLARWRSRYDIVLLDSPPILPVADAGILCRKTDGIILVIRQETARMELADSLDRLCASGGKVVGTVFIASRRHRGYGYGYVHSSRSQA